MNEKKSKDKKYQLQETSSVVNDSQAGYAIKPAVDLFHEERLYSHEEVFEEFAKKMNERIGTNIPT